MGAGVSKVEVYILRIDRGFRKQGIEYLMDLFHHVINQVLITGHLSGGISINQSG